MIFQHCSSQEGKLIDKLGEKGIELIIGWLVNEKKKSFIVVQRKNKSVKKWFCSDSLKSMTPASSNVSLVFLLTSAFVGTVKFLS